MKIAETISMLKGAAAGTQATSPDSRSADDWIKQYLSDKQKRLNDLRVRMNFLLGPEKGEVHGAWRMDKIDNWQQDPDRAPGQGDWFVTDPEGIIISRWPTREEAEKAAYNLYKGIVPSNSQGNQVRRLVRGRVVQVPK